MKTPHEVEISTNLVEITTKIKLCSKMRQFLPFQQKGWKYPFLCNWKTPFFA